MSMIPIPHIPQNAQNAEAPRSFSHRGAVVTDAPLRVWIIHGKHHSV